jgi:malate dehydrogenase
MMFVNTSKGLARKAVASLAPRAREILGDTFSSSFHSTAAANGKVAVLGAAGGIGQPLSLLLKLSPEVRELACYDVANAPGVAADLSHIPTKATVFGASPENDGLAKCLKGADLVIIPAGVPRKPGMTRDDLFNINASIVKTLVEGCATHCPNAVIAIISNPVNSTVAIAAEVLKQHNVYDPRKLLGVTTLDVIRARTFVAESQGWDPKDVDVTVVGGHAGITILPLYSQVVNAKFTDETLEALTVRTQFGGDEVVKAKAGTGSATLSMAYAGFIFGENILKALRGEKDIVQCAYVESSLTEARFFASACRFGKDGVEEVLPFGTMTAYEKKWFDKFLPELKTQIQTGIDYANKK